MKLVSALVWGKSVSFELYLLNISSNFTALLPEIAYSFKSIAGFPKCDLFTGLHISFKTEGWTQSSSLR